MYESFEPLNAQDNEIDLRLKNMMNCTTHSINSCWCWMNRHNVQRTVRDSMNSWRFNEQNAIRSHVVSLVSKQWANWVQLEQFEFNINYNLAYWQHDCHGHKQRIKMFTSDWVSVSSLVITRLQLPVCLHSSMYQWRDCKQCQELQMTQRDRLVQQSWDLLHTIAMYDCTVNDSLLRFC